MNFNNHNFDKSKSLSPSLAMPLLTSQKTRRMKPIIDAMHSGRQLHHVTTRILFRNFINFNSRIPQNGFLQDDAAAKEGDPKS